MTRGIIKLPRAETDFIRCYAYLAEERSTETADAFLGAIERTLAVIAKSPGIGAPHETNNRQLAGLRSLPVTRYKRYILFYRAFDDRIELVRVPGVIDQHEIVARRESFEHPLARRIDSPAVFDRAEPVLPLPVSLFG